MGKLSTDSKAQRDESPGTVNFTDFSYLVSTTEVTQQLYQEVTGINPSKFTAPMAPVESIPWMAARF